ncbi:uncharacterized protein LOC108825053 [Raphanus sativus]|uniref:Uncharacterized protein LOC108825053 n=1 Tax=Raphanus sativus TaxID=3726 RepID=A0A9W3CH92_RAPSA|nr:uncharacterized protein LOC108825053 [Raphanus sativus]
MAKEEGGMGLRNLMAYQDLETFVSHFMRHHLTIIDLSLPSNTLDTYEWELNGVKHASFALSLTWDTMRPLEDKKQWTELIWLKGSVPKHSFNMWIANADRFPTRARLASWGFQITATCCLCSRHDETRDHLLIQCEFSLDVWLQVSLRFNHPNVRFHNWSELLSWL